MPQINTSVPSNSLRLSKVIKKDLYIDHTHSIDIPLYKIQKELNDFSVLIVSGGRPATSAQRRNFTVGPYELNVKFTWVSACYNYGWPDVKNATANTGYWSGDRCYNSMYHGTAYYNANTEIQIVHKGYGLGLAGYAVYKNLDVYIDSNEYKVVVK